MKILSVWPPGWSWVSNMTFKSKKKIFLSFLELEVMPVSVYVGDFYKGLDWLPWIFHLQINTLSHLERNTQLCVCVLYVNYVIL